MNSKKAKEIRRKLIAKHGYGVEPSLIREAKRIYTRQGTVLSQQPKLQVSKRQQRLQRMKDAHAETTS